MYVLLILLAIVQICYCDLIDFKSICQAGIRQDNTNYIHCARKQLKYIPNFSRITNKFYDELVLNDNQIIEISSNIFNGLRVKRLNLSGNKIRHISTDAFVELSNYLEDLIIEFDPNYIDDIPYAIKHNLINLRVLKLINLNLNSIKNDTFIKYRKLEQLSIVKSNIKTIETNAFQSLVNLRYLNLEQNHLNDSSWFHIIKYLSNLEILILSQNNFTILKENRHMKNLKILDLSSNGLQLIEKQISINLEKLYLQNNELNSLQLTFLYSLFKLKELNFDFNRLTFLPDKIFQSNKNLIYLSLQGNDLNLLTNKSFFGLNNLLNLNLARNRLQFHSNIRPFHHLNALKILNLDRNVNMNLTEMILENLSNSLIELSLQNCNLKFFNYSLKFLIKLQRVKLSSNKLKQIPKYFLSNSLVSVDLQRNLLTKIPDLCHNRSDSLIDIDLSSNRISSISRYDLLKYPNLKRIGLNGNPLNCNCHLKWIKNWLEMNYDRDLVTFLQWTCSKPESLHGKQLTAINEQDMICDDVEQQSTLMPFLLSTDIRLTSIINNNSTIIYRSSKELFLNDVIFNSNGLLIISWEYMSKHLPKYYHMKIYDRNSNALIYEQLIDGRQHSMEIDISVYIKTTQSSNYLLCIDIQNRSYCKNFHVELNSKGIQSTSFIISSNEQLIYLIVGILCGAVLVCLILIIICYYRLCLNSKTNSNENIKKTLYYHPLNIVSYPVQQSSNTSECSLHSSVDTNHITNEPYHVYHQIASVKNCQLHSTRTNFFV